jgi:hypothetical protein
LLIDSSHRRWIVATIAVAVSAVAVYETLRRFTPGGVSGGSIVGLWYGIAGSGLMIFAGLLSALRRVPSWWWIGSRKAWLKGHIWLGLLSVVIIFCHSGYRFGGVLEQALWIVLAIVIVSGIFGLLVQQFLPRLLTTRVQAEAPYEQIPHLCKLMAGKANHLVSSIWETGAKGPQLSVQMSQMGMGAKVQLQEFFESQVLPFLSKPFRRSFLLARPLQAETAFARLKALPGLADSRAQLDELELLCDERRQLAEQERLHHWLHGWLMIHVPLSVALLVLAVAHAVVCTVFY